MYSIYICILYVKDFLDSRSQAVVLNGVKSDKIAVFSVSPEADHQAVRAQLAYRQIPTMIITSTHSFLEP